MSARQVGLSLNAFRDTGLGRDRKVQCTREQYINQDKKYTCSVGKMSFAPWISMFLINGVA